jgi:hypothetical protein
MSIAQPSLTPYPSGSDTAAPRVLPANKLAVRSVVLGILAFCLTGPVTGVPGIVFGVKARRAVRAGQANNPGAAMVGLILSWAGTVLVAAAVALIATGVVAL